MIILKRHLTALTFGAILAVAGQANAADPVKLGLINPIKTLIGKQNVEGAQLAVEMLNQDGGILGGRKIELVTYDTNFSPPEGVAAIQRLLTQDKVKVIAGEISSSVALAAIPVVEGEDAIFMAAVPKHPDVTKSGYDKVFRMNTTTAQDAKSFDTFLVETIKPEKVAILAENSDFGQVTIKHMKELFGNKLVYSDTFGMQQNDFAAMSTNARSSGADTICIVGSNMEQYGNILRVLSDLGFKGHRCLMPGILNSEGVKIAGAAAEQAFSADIYVPAIDNAFNKRFVEAFQKKFGRKPEKIEVLGFETVWIAAKAMDKAGTADDTAKIAKTIHEGKWETPRGEVTFDKNGQASSGELLRLSVKSGEIVVDR
ncbi:MULTISPECIES: ABC transporter substrate-binding protein [unclassified Chelatococcus]|uniref:ABC transporter substrate-binding protein n=1 Tax=unclassified Chelatococcus TaxID=2638111 RepID=UPI001BCF7BB2|nr:MULTISPECIES: ABC transporter substrate-binding protein [unclassified Chelatococcus]CAH1654405.1 Amino acid/amide ABC transporter substrate-binding protein (HAAT family) [Hyphomicrobiales bacterium]MBS7740247.1 ABC transporter substrate-binding protein [Chelatococcus sp. HY11]MBX3544924.1 ABC transporter substrate-binding protein [Chelatococcus sp.]MCO5078512.1 ABC transporter substrate-binding protein [Chelatococcus sp.]CAH1685424.1 Amino acid/amide ABC transporter substrate-binding protei